MEKNMYETVYMLWNVQQKYDIWQPVASILVTKHCRGQMHFLIQISINIVDIVKISWKCFICFTELIFLVVTQELVV